MKYDPGTFDVQTDTRVQTTSEMLQRRSEELVALSRKLRDQGHLLSQKSQMLAHQGVLASKIVR